MQIGDTRTVTIDEAKAMRKLAGAQLRQQPFTFPKMPHFNGPDRVSN